MNHEIETKIASHQQALQYFEELILGLREQGIPLSDPIYQEITFAAWLRLQEWELLVFDFHRVNNVWMIAHDPEFGLDWLEGRSEN